MGTGSLSPGVKRPGRGADHPPPSSSEVKERVELYRKVRHPRCVRIIMIQDNSIYVCVCVCVYIYIYIYIQSINTTNHIRTKNNYLFRPCYWAIVRLYRTCETIQGVPGGIDKTSGECSLC